MNLNFTIYITVTFFSGKRKYPPCLSNEKYFPHLVVKDDDEYLGVSMMNGSNCSFDKVYHAVALPIYEGVDYSKLKIGTDFFVMEGGNIVGEGTVDEIFHYIPLKTKDTKER